MFGKNGRSSSTLLVLLAVLLLQGCDGDINAPGLNADANSNSANSEPALSVASDVLEQSLHCTPFDHPDKPPVLLVHGTFATGALQYSLFYAPQLINLGFDVCTVTYPDRGLGDIQESAEYVVYALRTIRERSGRKVAMIGHSQGATMPRWALKYWPSARNAVSDFVMLAGPNHGTIVAAPGDLVSNLADLIGPLPVGLLPAALYQFAPQSQFIASLNAGDETPGDIDYTSLYTIFDELVQPALPVATSTLEPGQSNPHLTNLLLQDLCPGYLVDHVAIGTTDPVSFALAVDAITHSGPADVQRSGGTALCTLLPVDIAGLQQAPLIQGLLNMLTDTLSAGIPNPHLVAQEPPLKDYATVP